MTRPQFAGSPGTWPKTIVVFAVLAAALGVALLGHDIAVAVDEERVLHGNGVRGTFVVQGEFHEGKGDQGTYTGTFRAPGHNRALVYSHAYLLTVGDGYWAVLRSDGYSVYVQGHPDWLGLPLLVPLVLSLGIGVPLGVGTLRRIRNSGRLAALLRRQQPRS
jgi:hypothetical protein